MPSPAPVVARRRRRGRQDVAGSRDRTSARSAQPVVRTPSGDGTEAALYLCERGQMDWFDGPFVGMEPGPYGDGAGCSMN